MASVAQGRKGLWPLGHFAPGFLFVLEARLDFPDIESDNGRMLAGFRRNSPGLFVLALIVLTTVMPMWKGSALPRAPIATSRLAAAIFSLQGATPSSPAVGVGAILAYETAEGPAETLVRICPFSSGCTEYSEPLLAEEVSISEGDTTAHLLTSIPDFGSIDAWFSTFERNLLEVTCWGGPDVFQIDQHPDKLGGFTILAERPTNAFVAWGSSIGPWKVRGSDCGSIMTEPAVAEWWFV